MITQKTRAELNAPLFFVTPHHHPHRQVLPTPPSADR